MPGILTMDVHAADPSHILTGGNDRCATVFNKDTKQVVAVLKGHTKKVTKVLYHPEEEKTSDNSNQIIAILKNKKITMFLVLNFNYDFFTVFRRNYIFLLVL